MGTWTATPRTWVAGEVPTAAHFNADVRDLGRGFADAWTSYTPTLTASSSNPTNWTQTGYYLQVGKLVIAKFTLTAGGSMTAGSGDYRVALPVNCNTTMTAAVMGSVLLIDNDTGYAWTGLARYSNTAYPQLVYAAGAGLMGVTAAYPWTWAANDVISGSLMYEAA